MRTTLPSLTTTESSCLPSTSFHRKGAISRHLIGWPLRPLRPGTTTSPLGRAATLISPRKSTTEAQLESDPRELT